MPNFLPLDPLPPDKSTRTRMFSPRASLRIRGGLMVHAGEKGEFEGLLRLHPLQVDDEEMVVAVLPAVVEQAPPSWLVSADSWST